MGINSKLSNGTPIMHENGINRLIESMFAALFLCVQIRYKQPDVLEEQGAAKY